MAEIVERYWLEVPICAQVLGRGGELLTVEDRPDGGSAVVGGRRWDVDPWAKAKVLEPNMGDAVIALMRAFPETTMERLES